MSLFIEIKNYTEKLGLIFSSDDVTEVIKEAELYGITEPKEAVWHFLDEFEGVAHSLDPEYWEGKDNE